jgi:hypothetical protein
MAGTSHLHDEVGLVHIDMSGVKKVHEKCAKFNSISCRGCMKNDILRGDPLFWSAITSYRISFAMVFSMTLLVIFPSKCNGRAATGPGAYSKD